MIEINPLFCGSGRMIRDQRKIKIELTEGIESRDGLVVCPLKHSSWVQISPH